MRGATKAKPRTGRRTGPTTIDEYLARLDDDQRAALQRVREIVRKVAPKAEECISYQLPAFRVDDRCVLWFGAAARHCALYGVHDQDLGGYDTSGRGTLRFTPDAPLPAALVRRLVKARIAQNAARRAAKTKTRRK
jgi:uncharacterized protein YdhG (YjbR/CyaY superfamily)